MDNSRPMQRERRRRTRLCRRSGRANVGPGLRRNRFAQRRATARLKIIPSDVGERPLHDRGDPLTVEAAFVCLASMTVHDGSAKSKRSVPTQRMRRERCWLAAPRPRAGCGEPAASTETRERGPFSRRKRLGIAQGDREPLLGRKIIHTHVGESSLHDRRDPLTIKATIA